MSSELRTARADLLDRLDAKPFKEWSVEELRAVSALLDAFAAARGVPAVRPPKAPLRLVT